MSDHRTYVSVMTPAASSGNIVFQFDTYDAETNITVVATITGVTAGMAEEDIAIRIETQLTAQLPAYSGAPSFSSDPYQATFRFTRTEHIVCAWSQASNRWQLLSDGTGCNPTISDVPILMSYNRYLRLSGAFDGTTTGITTSGGVTLTVSQGIALIESVSAEMIGYLNNNLAISTYLGEWRTNDTKSMFTSPCPGLYIDEPVVRRRTLYEVFSIPQYSTAAFNWIRHTGELNFRFSQTYVDVGEPFNLNNEVRVTFVAGEDAIPVAILRVMVQLGKLGLMNTGAIDSLAGGSFKVSFRKLSESLQYYFRPIAKYKMKRMR